MALLLARRLAQYAGVLLVALVLNFALPRLAPGNPVDFLLPPEQAGKLTSIERSHAFAAFGLDRPVGVQFVDYLRGVARGDLLLSIRYGRPVTALIRERLPWTLVLVGTSSVLAIGIGTTVGFWSAWRRGTPGDVRAIAAMMIFHSIPPFFTGMLLILTFSVYLHVFPIFGAIPIVPSQGLELVLEIGQRLVLPLVTLTLFALGPIYLVARSALISELQEDYVLAAAAKGLSERSVRRHAERNALLPVITIALLNIGQIVGGAIVIETVFSYPGLGRLIYESVISRDYPVLQGLFLLLVITVLTANLLGDLLYPLLDPRIRRPSEAT